MLKKINVKEEFMKQIAAMEKQIERNRTMIVAHQQEIAEYDTINGKLIDEISRIMKRMRELDEIANG
jgi:hypothetical protein